MFCGPEIIFLCVAYCVLACIFKQFQACERFEALVFSIAVQGNQILFFRGVCLYYGKALVHVGISATHPLVAKPPSVSLKDKMLGTRANDVVDKINYKIEIARTFRGNSRGSCDLD